MQPDKKIVAYDPNKVDDNTFDDGRKDGGAAGYAPVVTQPTQPVQTAQPQQTVNSIGNGIGPVGNGSGNGNGGGNPGYGYAQPAQPNRGDVAAWSNPYQDQMDKLYNDILNRGKFNYDLYSDNLYKQYKEQYETLGNRAMQDTMGQAAALTGGYGSTYSQAAGQQAYQNYLQQLNNIIPSLYDRAYTEFKDGEDWKLKAYDLTRDRYNAALTDRNNNYSLLAQKIAAGYTPTEQELTAAGMNWSDYDLYRPQASASGYGNGNQASNASNKDLKAAADYAAYIKGQNNPAQQTQAVQNQTSGNSSVVSYGIGSIARMPDDVLQQNFAAEWSQARTEAEKKAIEDKYTQAINSRG